MPVSRKKLLAQRGWVTRTLNSAELVLTSDNPPLPILNQQKDELDGRWRKYEEVWCVYEEENVDEDNDEEFKEEFTKHEQKETAVKATMLRLGRLINDLGQTGSNRTSATPTLGKLPEIHLPDFYGDLEKWPAFWDIYQSLVHNRSDLTPVVKFAYLRSALKGKAAEAVKGFQTTDLYYPDAIDTFKENFANPKKLQRCLVHKWLALKTPKCDHKDLVNFKLEYESTLRALKNYVDTDTCEWMITEQILTKLPVNVVEYIYQHSKSQYPSYLEIGEGLQSFIELMAQKTKFNKEINTGRSTLPPRTDMHKPDRTQIGSYVLSVNDQSCLFCQKKDHYSSQCTLYGSFKLRRERLGELGRCLRCVRKGHEVNNCRIRFPTCRTCGKDNHHGLLCFKLLEGPRSKFKSENSNPTVQVGVTTPQSTSVSVSSSNRVPATARDNVSLSVGTMTISSETNSLCATSLPTATGSVRNPTGQTELLCRIFFDLGSQRSFITSKVSNYLKLVPLFETSMKICSFRHEGDESRYRVVNPVVTLGKTIQPIKAVVLDSLDVNIHSPGLLDLADMLREKGVKLADSSLNSDVINNIDVMIGTDYFFKFIKGIDHKYGIDLLTSSGGKLISGPIPSNITPSSSASDIAMHVTVMRVTENHSPLSTVDLVEEGNTDIHKLYDLETIGIQPSEMAPDDKLTLESYMNSVKYEDGQYWTRLPWKLNGPMLPNNFRMALGQLYSLIDNLRKKPSHLIHYNNVLEEQLNSKFIEVVPYPQSQQKENCHYLPHHAVEKNSVTTPLRVVFNCSARANKSSASLNDCLLTGPSLTEKLGDVLTKFRTEDYAYTADISKAFLRVGLQEIDRDFTRFLWVKDIHADNLEIITYRFTSVLFGSTSSPFLLQATLTKHFRDSDSPIKNILLNNFYVDNFQGVVNDEKALFHIYSEANKELQKANMPLQSWNSNSLALKSLIQTDSQTEVPVNVSVLGMKWNTETDTLSLNTPKFKTYNTLTKRKLLSLVSSVFDPLGLFVPITIKGKILMQKAWMEKLDWDMDLPEQYENEWKELLIEFENIQTYEFPRSVGCGNSVNELHVFSDASSKAYGAVAYIVSEFHSERISRLVTSRGRVKPLQTRSIPQMELTAMQVGMQLIHYLVITLKWKFNKIILWSDNEASLQWVRNENSNIIYVQNRVKTILSIKEEINCNVEILYVPTKENPADLLSKGMSWKQFICSNLWVCGPDWLVTKQWPTQKMHVIVNEITTMNSDEILSPILPYENFSSLYRLKIITNFVLKFINMKFGLNLEPLNYWLKFIQSQHYQSVLKFLAGSLPVSGNKETKKFIEDLGLFFDSNGLLRCRGRIQNSSLPLTTRYPILLPPKNHFTELIVRRAHRDVSHGGLSETLSQLRTEYWIPRGRQTVKDIINKCVLCKRVAGRAYKYPGPPPLPDFRVNLVEPFHTTGVDYTGAIQLSKTLSGFPQKFYICLFTCSSTRAIHLELARDLKADTFLLLFRRFCARRSMPRHLISDNATNFISTNSSLKIIMDDPLVQEYLNKNSVNWHFIAPRAPWQGGFYERLIGVVKVCLRKILYHRKVTEDELLTILTEVEARVNNRPLLYIGDEFDSNETLTPSHLLNARRIRTMPLLTESASDPMLCENNLIQQYMKVSSIMKHFESVWSSEYLTALRGRYYGAQNPVEKNCFNIGDIVLVQSERPRDLWALGRIEQLCPDKDNIVRMVEVLSGGRLSKRTIDKLVPLEVSSVGVCPQETLTVDSETIPALLGSGGTGFGSGGRLDSQETLTVDSGNTSLPTELDRVDQPLSVNSRVKRKTALQSDRVRKALMESGQL